MALSMALFTAVIEGANSGLNYFKEITAATDGSYTGVYQDVSTEEGKAFLQNNEIDQSITFQEIGYAQSPQYTLSYIRILSGPMESSLLRIPLKSGYYPMKSDEIILPADETDENGNYYSLNQEITLNVGTLYRSGTRLGVNEPIDYNHSEQNKLENTSSKTYKIVGFYNKVPAEVNGASSYTAFTADDTGGDGNVDVYFTLHNVRKFSDLKNAVPNPDNLLVHKELVRFTSLHEADLNRNVVHIVFGFAAVLILIVICGSVAMIANSFSISISERMKEYGMLKSIGASKRQIRTSVLTEAFISSLAGIIPGILFGFGGLALAIHLVAGRLRVIYSDTPVKIHIAPSWTGLLIAAAICLITALIAAWRPASKAVKAAPLDAIRQTDSMQIKPGKIHTSRLTWKLFGLEGALTSKNFKRSRSRFRSIIFSLSMSVILFISSSSLTAYMTRMMSQDYQQNPSDVMITSYSSANVPGNANTYASDLFQKIRNLGDISEAACILNKDSLDASVPKSTVTDDYLKQYPLETGKTVTLSTQTIVIMDDDSFRKMLENNNVSNVESYFDADHPKGVLYNNEETFNNSNKVKTVSFIKDSAFPLTVTISAHKNIEGETFYFQCGDHGEYACYYKNGTEEGAAADEDDAHKVPYREAITEKQLTIGAPVTDTGMDYETMATMIYPSSAYDALENMGIISDSFFNMHMYFKTNHHAETAKDIEQYLENNDIHNLDVYDQADSREASRSILFTIRVFSFAFILLISIIAITNIFNTITTNMQIRKREYAMLRSIGMTGKSFKKMLLDECLTYGIRSLVIALPLSVAVTYLIYQIADQSDELSFFIPAGSIIAAMIAIFVIIALSMIYGQRKLAKENLVDALRNETV